VTQHAKVPVKERLHCFQFWTLLRAASCSLGSRLRGTKYSWPGVHGKPADADRPTRNALRARRGQSSHTRGARSSAVRRIGDGNLDGGTPCVGPITAIGIEGALKEMARTAYFHPARRWESGRYVPRHLLPAGAQFDSRAATGAGPGPESTDRESNGGRQRGPKFYSGRHVVARRACENCGRRVGGTTSGSDVLQQMPDSTGVAERGPRPVTALVHELRFCRPQLYSRLIARALLCRR